MVICHGNVCRSPYAAAALRRSLATSSPAVRVESAGFIGPDRAPPPEALASAADRGSDMSDHRSQLITPELLDASDLILVMNPAQAVAIAEKRPGAAGRVLVLGDLDPRPFALAEIDDPWDKPKSEFDACYDRIDRCVALLVRAAFPA